MFFYRPLDYGYASARGDRKQHVIARVTTEETLDGIILSFDSNQYHPTLTCWGADAIPLAPQKLVAVWKYPVEAMYEVKKCSSAE